MPLPIALEASQDADFTKQFLWVTGKRPNEVPIDFTGYAGKAVARRERGNNDNTTNPAVLTWDTNLSDGSMVLGGDDGTDGTIMLSTPQATIETVTPGVYYLDIVIYSSPPYGQPFLFAGGTITVQGGTT